jgi:hypothetical protein
MYFINGLRRTPRGNDSIWVIVYRLIKVAHFIPVRTLYGGDKLAKLYVNNILKLHGVPKRIVSDRVHNLHPSSGRAYTRHLEPNWILARHIILKPMDRLRELIKCWKIC